VRTARDFAVGHGSPHWQGFGAGCFLPRLALQHGSNQLPSSDLTFGFLHLRMLFPTSLASRRQADAERAGWKVGEQAPCPLRVPRSVLHMLIRSHESVRATKVEPFLLQHGIEVLVPPLALKPHVLAKMPFSAQTEALK
jgi:hypothetical protein